MQALRETQMEPHEHFEFLIKHGLIDREGRVLCNRLFGGNPPDESNGTPPVSDTSAEKKP